MTFFNALIVNRCSASFVVMAIVLKAVNSHISSTGVRHAIIWTSVNNALNISGYRIATLAKTLQSCFKLRVFNSENPDGADMLYFDEIKGKFEEMRSVLSPATSGLFTVEKQEKYNVLEYSSIKNVRFQFYIALLKYDHALVTLRAIVVDNTVKLLPCSNISIERREGKYHLNSRWKMATAFILGLQVQSQQFAISVRQNGKTAKARFEASSDIALFQAFYQAHMILH